MLSEVTWERYPLEKLLQERFQIATGFHPGQREIIELLVRGRRVLTIQGTGWGKSLCYQMASLYYPHLTIVFSPLKALMRDQCQKCNTVYAIPSAIVSSDFSAEENRATLEQAIAGNFKILFISPERLGNIDWQTYGPHMRINMIVIDEAHCISTWGHDFRPDYRRIIRLLDILPAHVPVLGLTATANRRVEQDILRQMGTQTQIIRGGMYRSNLLLNVVELRGDRNKLNYLGEVLPALPGTGVVYTATKSGAEMVTAFLQQQGIPAEYYHAKREDAKRQDIEQKLMGNQYKVICSTNALGMGIDKPDIRFIVHYHIPASPIHYYQEMGRAGRDGKESKCILLYDPADLTIQDYFIRNAKPEGRLYEAVLSLMRDTPQGVRESDLMRITGFSQQAIRKILSDLEEQGFISRNPQDRSYTLLSRPAQVDFSDYDTILRQKQQELQDIQRYATYPGCYMAYLTTYLGDRVGYLCRVCGHCKPLHFPVIMPSERIRTAAGHFLENEFLPCIEKRGTGRNPIHEAGWSLTYHGRSRIGELVRASKYENAGPFAQEIVLLAVDLIKNRYPVAIISGIVSVPPTKSGQLVEDFARKVATLLGIEYISMLTKVRSTQEQKNLTNWRQKEDNVKDAFVISSPVEVAGRTLLLIDDIYDSGYMLREVGKTLMQAGAKAVYPFTITRTLHSDDQ